jgi:putative intracellular protease/amidase
MCRLAELAEPYYIFKEAGYDVTLCSPKGGPIPIDAASLEGDYLTSEAKRFQQDGKPSNAHCCCAGLQSLIPRSSIQSSSGA